MTEARIDLPPLPVLPASNAERVLWVRWATQAVLAERERAARVCEARASDSDASIEQEWEAEECAAAIRKGD